jgi:hypothetical protein
MIQCARRRRRRRDIRSGIIVGALVVDPVRVDRVHVYELACR